MQPKAFIENPRCAGHQNRRVLKKKYPPDRGWVKGENIIPIKTTENWRDAVRKKRSRQFTSV